MAFDLITFVVLVLVFVVSALPLHLAVKLFGGRTNIVKTLVVMFVSGLVVSFIAIILPFGSFIALLVLIWIYREFFRLMWIKAFLVWIFQMIFIFLFTMLFAFVGLGVFSFRLLF